MSLNTRSTWLMTALLLAACDSKPDAKHPDSTTTMTPPAAGTTTSRAEGMTGTTGAATGTSLPATTTTSPMGGTTAPTGSAVSAADTKPATRFSDAEIAAIMEATNNGEIEEGKVAQKSGLNAGVKSFAAMMVTHHTEARDKQAKLFSKLAMAPADNAKSREIKADGQKSLDSLKPLKGADFDRAYIEAQIKEHQTVPGLLDGQLVPNAQSAEYKALLQEVRGRIEQHLKAAQELQTKLGKATGG